MVISLSDMPFIYVFLQFLFSFFALPGVFSVNLSVLLGHSREAAPSETE